MKPNNYTQLSVHLVFATKYRECLLNKNQQNETWRYIGGTINKLGHKCLKVNGVSDHVHILLGLNPVISISDLVRDIKRSSALFINSQNCFKKSFCWQEGYGAFSISLSDQPRIWSYIDKQEDHHKKVSFKDEYRKVLSDAGIDYNEKYLFVDL